MSDKPFLDTNILVYAFTKDDSRTQVATALLAVGGVISVQVLNEFVSVARRKLQMSWMEVNEALPAIRILCGTPLPLTVAMHESALVLAEGRGFAIYDALIVAAALQAGCTVLHSEDMQHGQVIDGLLIHNPFR